jgi:hypothetical protein
MKSVPSDNAQPYGTTLFNLLGDYWTRLYADSELLAKFSNGNGLAAAQTYLDFVETVLCLDRQNMPAYHREMFIPIVIKASEVNTGVALKIGQQPVVGIGPQLDGDYTGGDIFKVGGNAALKDTLSYVINTNVPFDKGIDSISNKLFSAEATLVSGKDFYVEGSVLFIDKTKDPFKSDRYMVREVSGANGTKDYEILLWGSNALVDDDFTHTHYGYPLGRYDKDPEIYRKQINALWDLQFVGFDIQVVKRALATLINVPSINEDGEVVETIVGGQDGESYVVTDKHSYLVELPDTIMPHIIPGAVLLKGDYLTDALKVYWNLDTTKFVYPPNDKITLSSFVADVPSLHLPKGVAGNYSADSGIIVDWADSPITYEGLDENGNWKIRFDLQANFGKSDIFWQEVWDRAEANSTDLAEVFAEFITGPAGNVGSVVGSINPLKYYMDNFLKANASIVTINFNSLPSSITSLRALTRLKSIVPAHTLLLLIGRLAITELPYDLSDSSQDVINYYDAFIVEDEGNIHGAVSSDTNLTYRDANLKTKWIRRCS